MKFWVIAMVIVGLSCASEDGFKTVKDNIPFNLSHPDKSFDLESELREISGLAYTELGLASIQDEKGTLYFLDPERGLIRQKFQFGKKGDYEDLEQVGDEFWIVRSDGVLVRVKESREGAFKSKLFITPLTYRNDVEGIFWDNDSRLLWLLCKEDPSLRSKKYSGKKAVYGYDIKSRELKTEPVMLLDELMIKKFFETKYGGIQGFKFKPSAIDRDPLSGLIYILSSRSSLLVALSADGKRIIDVVSLNSQSLEQPEAMTFTPSGDLIIASEGKDRPAQLRIYYRAQ